VLSLLILFGLCASILKVVEEYTEHNPNWKVVQTAFTILSLIQTAIILLRYVNKED
jgi:hypothetical protein